MYGTTIRAGNRRRTCRPANVHVAFTNRHGIANETKMDLYSGELRNTLDMLWNEMEDEIGDDIHLIDIADMIGYIRM